MTTRPPTVVVAIHDGFYGCGTGAGYANYGFLEVLTQLLPPETHLAVLPVWLSPGSPERQSAWHDRATALLAESGASVHPVRNGTDGTDRWGGVQNFRHLARDTARRLAKIVGTGDAPFLLLAFDVPFFGLAGALPPAMRRRLILVPRSTALIHTPGDEQRIRWERDSLRTGLADGTRIATISRFLHRHLRQDFGIPDEFLVPLQDGLAFGDWNRPKNTAPAFPPDEFILTLGRAEPYKGFDDVLDAIAIRRARHSRTPHLVLAATTEGTHPNRHQRALLTRIRREDIDATLVTRFTPDVSGLIQHPRLRAIVVPSRAEPFGRIPMESYAAGAGPVIATTAGGLAEQVTDGVTGFTYPPGSPGALADALSRGLSLTGGERAALRHRARQRALRDYNHPAAVHRFLSETAPWLDLPHPDDRLRLLSTDQPVHARSSVSDVRPVKVPIGLQAQHWTTIRPIRQVLAVAHHVTSLIRLRDVLTVFDADPRVQVVFSCPGSDPFRHGLDTLLAELGAIVIPWSQAIETEFDLAISANHGGLTELTAPIVVISHGIGYTKHSPGNRKPETGNRKPETGNRSVFGLSPEWLLYDGRPIAESLALSHIEQLDRLAANTPAAVDTAIVTGDPCYDRMLRSMHLRDRYRDALGMRRGQKLIAISTTWWHRSVLGSWPSLYRELLACLPADDYRVVAIVHPNIWHGHGPWQVHTWLADCTRAGMVFAPPVDGWQAALIAADLVIGDHGATTCYGAALRRPVLLAAYPEDDVARGSAVDVLGRSAPRLHRHSSLRAQVAEAIALSDPDDYADVRELVSSCPGQAASRLRRLFYRHLNLPEPDSEPPVQPIPVASVASLPRPDARADLVVFALDDDGGPATLTRFPADVTVDRTGAGYLDAAHLIAHEDHPRRSLLDEAAVIVAEATAQQPLRHTLEAVLRRHPGAVLAVAAREDGQILLRTRASAELVLDGAGRRVCAAFVHAWLLTGNALDEIPRTQSVHSGGSRVTVRVHSVSAASA